MMSRIKCLIFILVALFALPVAAQNKKAPKSKTRKADKAYNMANYAKAIELYKKSYAKHKSKNDKAATAYKTGQSYLKLSNWKEALNWFEKSVNDGNKDPNATWMYAECLRANGRYDEAIAKYNAYKEMAPEDTRTAGAIAACTTAQGWKDKPTRAVVENAGVLNSKYYDFAPTQSNNEKGVFFTSSRMESTGNTNDGWYGEKFFDLFTSSMDNNGKWSTPVAVPAPVNSSASDGTSAWDAKSKTLYFSRCGKIKGKEGVCRLYMSVYDGSKWSDPQPLPFATEDYNTGHPAVSEDGNTLIFSSDMPGTVGGKDLYMSTKDASGNWSAPVSLGGAINTTSDDMYPTLSGNKLYFASAGHLGMGGLDIFSATNNGGTWGDITNMQSPINSPADDFGIMFLESTNGFISSNRDGGQGADDIYTFRIPPPVFSVSGRVYDTDTKESIPDATVELFGSDGTSLSVRTGSDGVYRYQLNPETKYKISASYTGYLTKFLEVSTVGLMDSKDFVGDFDFPLKSTAKPIELVDIFYDLDKATLRDDSKKELDNLIKILSENPTITIRIEAHTDSRATDEYNNDLSKRRAKSVVDYLVKNGVDKDRLSSEGFGETKLRVSDAEIEKLASEEEKEAAHQKNRRTEFSVLGTDFVPKKK
ncbi:MAG: OmpA family protein [Bacteroidota bacterium]|jgi:peptidoglycan-associated lipoprotein